MSNALQAALAKLGNTADEVYQSLQKAGIKGNRNSCSSCPIANYLKKELGYEHVLVGSDVDARPDRMGNKEGERFYNVPLTDAALNFIKRFDAGEGYGNVEA